VANSVFFLSFNTLNLKLKYAYAIYIYIPLGLLFVFWFNKAHTFYQCGKRQKWQDTMANVSITCDPSQVDQYTSNFQVHI